ncbi:MAG: aminopeptidase P N-terminal domain-containing protein [Myxococcota bacterium]
MSVRARRERLAERVGRAPVLLMAGAPVPRNFPANPHPFRASSHFLYFVGRAPPGSAALMESGSCALFVPRPDPDDILWHGPPERDTAALEEATGCTVRHLDELEAAVARAGGQVATLPAPDAASRALQQELLGRPIRTGWLVGPDERLAEAVVALRLVHDAEAVAELRRAVDATAAAHRGGMAATRPGLREREVWAAMQAELTARGSPPAYGPIVTVRGEVLHDETQHRALRPEDLLLADVGGESAGGWASDVTRTWPVTGRFTPSQRALYEVVLTAQRAAIAAVAPGARFRDVHLAACRALAEGLVGLGILRGDPEELVGDGVHALFFPHGVGHLIGLDVHDMEDLGDRAGYPPGRTRDPRFGLSALRLDRELASGMAVTIEPGFYQVPGLLADPARVGLSDAAVDRAQLARHADVRGIRIEDDVLVTDGGAEVLSAAIPKEPSEVEAAVGIRPTP